MPKINGAELCAGVGNGVVSRGPLNGAATVLQSGAGEACWWDGRVLYQHNTPGRSFLEADGAQEIDGKGANRLMAGGPVWAAWLGGDGYRDSLGRKSSTWNVAGVGPDGTVAVLDYASGSGLLLLGVDARFDDNGHLISGSAIGVPGAAPDRQLVQVLSAGTAVWTEHGNQQIRSVGVPKPLEFLTHVGFWLKAVTFQGRWWIAYQDETDRVIFHEAGKTTGYVITKGAAFGLDVSADGWIVYALGEGEAPDQIRVVNVASLPLTDLAPVVVKPPPDVEPKPQPKPQPKPTGASMFEDPRNGFDIRAVEVVNGPNAIRDWKEVDAITAVRWSTRTSGDGFWIDWPDRRSWPDVFPGGTTERPEKRPPGIDIGLNDDIRYSIGMVFRHDGRTRLLVYQRRHYGGEGEWPGGPAIDQWGPDIFYKMMDRNTVIPDGTVVGLVAFHGHPYGMRDGQEFAVGTQPWRTSVRWVTVRRRDTVDTFSDDVSNDGGGGQSGNAGGNTGGSSGGNTGSGETSGVSGVDLGAVIEAIKATIAEEMAGLRSELEATREQMASTERELAGVNAQLEAGFSVDTPRLPVIGVVHADIKPKPKKTT